MVLFETADARIAAWLLTNGVRLLGATAHADTAIFQFWADGTRIDRLLAAWDGKPSPKANVRVYVGNFLRARRIATQAIGSKRIDHEGQQEPAA